VPASCPRIVSRSPAVMAGEGEPARKILRCELADGSGAARRVLDDHLGSPAGDGAIRILDLQRAGKAPDESRGISARHALKPRRGLG